jgi:hypothetical protein
MAGYLNLLYVFLYYVHSSLGEIMAIIEIISKSLSFGLSILTYINPILFFFVVLSWLKMNYRMSLRLDEALIRYYVIEKQVDYLSARCLTEKDKDYILMLERIAQKHGDKLN